MVAHRAVVAFDHHAGTYFTDRRRIWEEARKCPVAYNPAYGGFWVVSGHHEVATVARDEATFSSSYPVASDPIEYLGINGLPRREGFAHAGIAEAERDLHVALRRTLNPFLLPRAVADQQPFLEQLTTWAMDQYITTGNMDLVTEFLGAIPSIASLRVIGLPFDNWEHYRTVFHSLLAFPRHSPEHTHALNLVPGMVEEITQRAHERRQDPRNDILSAIAHLEVEGKRLDDEQLVSVMWNLIAGGLDTTTSLTALTLYHLATHPDLRARLAGDVDLLAPATEEFLRFTTVNETLTRTVTRDVELGGQHLKRGDYLMIGWMSANFDEKVFDRPNEMILDRPLNPHLAFGIGVHRCIGMHLARAQFKVMVREVLTRIPDYEVDRDATSFYETNPELAGVIRMPVTFEPGRVVGVPRPF